MTLLSNYALPTLVSMLAFHSDGQQQILMTWFLNLNHQSPIIINWCLETHDNTTGFHRPCWFRMIDWTIMLVNNFFIFEYFLLRLPYSTNYAPFWKQTKFNTFNQHHFVLFLLYRWVNHVLFLTMSHHLKQKYWQ